MRLVILGATGSIGNSAFSVWEQHRDHIAIEGLAARGSADRLWEMGCAMNARWVALTDEKAARDLEVALQGSPGPMIVAGEAALLAQLAESDATHVLAAMTGFAGLAPTMAALNRGLTVLLANKETLVAAGDLVTEAAARAGATIIPVDSEHSAIFQCLGMGQPYRRLILTCSGGPFRGWTRQQLGEVTVDAALRHPNWVMGPKITIDTATLMNKGLEIIEAHHLFHASYDAIDVVVHPQSVIHSLVEFVDGATLAQCGVPDMRVPIAVGLSWPERWELDVPPFEWSGSSLTFEQADEDTFRLLALAKQAGRAGGLYPAVLNAANEAAVAAFLDGRTAFLDIAAVVEETLNRYTGAAAASNLDDVVHADAWARRQTSKLLTQVGHNR